MKYYPTLLVAAVLLAACADADIPMAPSDTHAVNAATTHNRQRTVVIEDAVAPNPCTGEDVLLHIDQLFILNELTLEGKFFHGHFTFLDRGTKGVGLTTGVTYHQTGAEQDFLHIKGEVGAQEVGPIEQEFGRGDRGQGSEPERSPMPLFVRTRTSP